MQVEFVLLVRYIRKLNRERDDARQGAGSVARPCDPDVKTKLPILASADMQWPIDPPEIDSFLDHFSSDNKKEILGKCGDDIPLLNDLNLDEEDVNVHRRRIQQLRTLTSHYRSDRATMLTAELELEQEVGPRMKQESWQELKIVVERPENDVEISCEDAHPGLCHKDHSKFYKQAILFMRFLKHMCSKTKKDAKFNTLLRFALAPTAAAPLGGVQVAFVCLGNGQEGSNSWQSYFNVRCRGIQELRSTHGIFVYNKDSIQYPLFCELTSDPKEPLPDDMFGGGLAVALHNAFGKLCDFARLECSVMNTHFLPRGAMWTAGSDQLFSRCEILKEKKVVTKTDESDVWIKWSKNMDKFSKRKSLEPSGPESALRAKAVRMGIPTDVIGSDSENPDMNPSEWSPSESGDNPSDEEIPVPDEDKHEELLPDKDEDTGYLSTRVRFRIRRKSAVAAPLPSIDSGLPLASPPNSPPPGLALRLIQSHDFKVGLL